MAITITPIAGLGANTYAATVQYGADADVSSGNVAHGLGATPLEVHITPIAFGLTPVQFSATTIDGTNIVVTKSSGAANTACTILLVAKRPHSIGR